MGSEKGFFLFELDFLFFSIWLSRGSLTTSFSPSSEMEEGRFLWFSRFLFWRVDLYIFIPLSSLFIFFVIVVLF